MKKGLIGAVKYGVLLGVIVFVAFILVSSLNTFAFGATDAGSPVIFYTINQSVASGLQYTYPNVYGFQINATNGSISANVSTCVFYANFSGGWQNYTTLSPMPAQVTNNPYSVNMINPDGSVGNTTTFWINFTMDSFSRAETYYYAWVCNGTDGGKWNFTNNISGVWTNPYIIALNASTSLYMNLSINNSEGNKTRTYAPDTVNITANYSAVVFGQQAITFTLYKNTTTTFGTANGTNETNITGAGMVYYDYNTSGNTNYSAAAKHYHLNITQNTSTSDFLNMALANGLEANGTVTYPNGPNVTAWNDSSVFNGQNIGITLYRNLTGFGATTGEAILGVGNVTDNTILGAGHHLFTYNTSGNQNYSIGNKTFNITINQNTSYAFNLTLDQNITAPSTGSSITRYVGNNTNVSASFADSGAFSPVSQNIRLTLSATTYNLTNQDGDGGVNLVSNIENIIDTQVYLLNTQTIAKRVNLTLISNGNQNYSANTTGISFNITFNGYSNLTCTFSNAPYLMITTGGTEEINCFVRDNQTGVPLANYNVSLYNQTDGSVYDTLTNSSGWTEYNYVAPSSETTYILNATIHDNTSLFYSRTSVNNASVKVYSVSNKSSKPLIINGTGIVTDYGGTWAQMQTQYSFEGIMVYPNFTGGTFNGMVMPLNQYAPLTYNNRNFWEFPTTEEFLAYNITFEVNMTGSAARGLINVTAPVPSGGYETNAFYRNQTLLPARWATMSPPIGEMMNGTTMPSMTILMKNPDNFTVFCHNDTATWTIDGSSNPTSTPQAYYFGGTIVLNLTNHSSTENITVSMMMGVQDDTCI
ncbi:MAG: hypothetical protein KJ697_04320, partial [Nanoarchaeota archaeon]|nr:hypothetical protein [Nanoarchaeota archaeon]